MLLLSMIIICCKAENSKIDGIYYYTKSNEDQLICSTINYIELKDGYYYPSMNFFGNSLGSTLRFPFTVEEDKIVVSNPDGGELILDIVDENTIRFMECLLKKETEVKEDNSLVEKKEATLKTKDVSSHNSLIINKTDSFPIYTYCKSP